MDRLRGVAMAHQRTHSSQPLLPMRSPSDDDGWTSPTTEKQQQPPAPSRRRTLTSIALLLILVSLAAFTFINASALRQGVQVIQEACVPFENTTVHVVPENVTQVAPALEEQYVLGPPTRRFRDNLRNDTKYITSWISAGWTNDVMTYGNLVYLGLLTERVPIIPPFTPSHIGGDVPPIPFGDVFDVPRLREAVGPVIEWRDLKDPESTELEDIGCWNTWEAVRPEEGKPRESWIPHWVNLDVSYTRAPDFIKLTTYENDPSSSFWALSALSYPETRKESIGTIRPSPVHQATLEPDEHVACYDYLYYASVHKPFEWEMDYTPMWRQVVKHFRWTQRLETLADEYLRRTLGLAVDQELPPIITIHARHGDFSVYCQGRETEGCFAPLSVIARRVEEIQAELLQRKGVTVQHVVMTSDEADPKWWDEVKQLGWWKIDHVAAQTAETYGRWYPLMIDAVVQSRGLGFVGTEQSTMSVLARRRVQDWHDGAWRMVKWGHADADAH